MCYEPEPQLKGIKFYLGNSEQVQSAFTGGKNVSEKTKWPPLFIKQVAKLNKPDQCKELQ